MINGNISEFIDKLYCGEELLFAYKHNRYFLQGWASDTESIMVLDLLADKPFTDYLWKSVKTSMRECAEDFLASKLWDGQSFMQIQRDVVWID